MPSTRFRWRRRATVTRIGPAHLDGGASVDLTFDEWKTPRGNKGLGGFKAPLAGLRAASGAALAVGDQVYVNGHPMDPNSVWFQGRTIWQKPTLADR